MLENGLWAVGALAVGVGVFPMIAGLAGLVRPRGEEWTAERRAVVATMGSLIVGFGWYTAVKAAYISTTFSTLVVERNLIYVAPLLFVGTAMFFERPLTRWWAVAGAAGLTLAALLLAYQYKMDVRIYSDAPGFSLLQAANRTYSWTPDRARNVLIGFVVLSLARDRPAARAPVGNASGPRARRDAAPRLGDRRPDVGRERLEHVLRGDLRGHRSAVRLDRPRDRRRADALPRATAHRLQRHLADGVLEPVAQARLVDRRQRSRPRPDALARPRQRCDRRDHATADGGRVRRRRPRDRHRRHARREATRTTRRGRRRSGASSRSSRRCGSRTRREA